eukprot:TRINITY_DN7508_c0_g1_i4.p1 TRINITY_DN7508_c0_g1~~TRINITY_DN7508_c0_g1_i4.p1  ORF type:complete len:282 (+),score=48.23 TRINITY_DN7508_c0_g1_i4:7-852(+)
MDVNFDIESHLSDIDALLDESDQDDNSWVSLTSIDRVHPTTAYACRSARSSGAYGVLLSHHRPDLCTWVCSAANLFDLTLWAVLQVSLLGRIVQPVTASEEARIIDHTGCVPCILPEPPPSATQRHHYVLGRLRTGLDGAYIDVQHCRPSAPNELTYHLLAVVAADLRLNQKAMSLEDIQARAAQAQQAHVQAMQLHREQSIESRAGEARTSSTPAPAMTPAQYIQRVIVDTCRRPSGASLLRLRKQLAGVASKQQIIHTLEQLLSDGVIMESSKGYKTIE